MNFGACPEPPSDRSALNDERPLGALLRTFFESGFVLDALEEPALATGSEARSDLDWRALPEIPPILAGRLRPRDG